MLYYSDFKQAWFSRGCSTNSVVIYFIAHDLSKKKIYCRIGKTNYGVLQFVLGKFVNLERVRS